MTRLARLPTELQRAIASFLKYEDLALLSKVHDSLLRSLADVAVVAQALYNTYGNRLLLVLLANPHLALQQDLLLYILTRRCKLYMTSKEFGSVIDRFVETGSDARLDRLINTTNIDKDDLNHLIYTLIKRDRVDLMVKFEGLLDVFFDNYLQEYIEEAIGQGSANALRHLVKWPRKPSIKFEWGKIFEQLDGPYNEHVVGALLDGLDADELNEDDATKALDAVIRCRCDAETVTKALEKHCGTLSLDLLTKRLVKLRARYGDVQAAATGYLVKRIDQAPDAQARCTEVLLCASRYEWIEMISAIMSRTPPPDDQGVRNALEVAIEGEKDRAVDEFLRWPQVRGNREMLTTSLRLAFLYFDDVIVDALQNTDADRWPTGLELALVYFTQQGRKDVVKPFLEDDELTTDAVKRALKVASDPDIV
jgi:hypothetical protein